MKKLFLKSVTILLLGIVLKGCGTSEQDPIVAKVGDREISLQALRAFRAKLPETFQSEKTGIEALRDDLQTLIDRELLILEARNQGLDQKDSFISEYEEQRSQKLQEKYLQREIRQWIEISEEELQRAFEEQNLGRSVRVSHIQTKTREEAEAALKEIRKGRSFAEVARERSLDQKTAAKGGDLETFFTRDKAIRIISDEVWSMDVGEVSEPIRVRDDHYEIVQVTAERPVSIEYWRPKLHSDLFKQRFAEEQEVLIELLTEELHVKMNEEALQILLRRSDSQGPMVTLSATEESMMLYEFDGGGVTLGEYLLRFRSDRSRFAAPLDSTQVISFVKRAILPEKLLVEGAHRAGIENDPEVAVWLRKKWEELLIRTLRREEVVERIAITDEDIQEEYETHPDRYMLSPEIWIQEILVEREEEAQELLQALQDGADMEELAAQYTLRERMRKHKGRLRMRPFEKSAYGGLYEEAEHAELNKTLGPLKVKGGYSIFRVLERLPRRPEPLQSAKRRVRAILRMECQENLFREFVNDLRVKYDAQVQVFEEALRAVADATI